MAVFNYLDPSFFLRIAKPDGTIRFFGAGYGSEAEHAMEGRFLESVTINETVLGNSNMTATLTPPVHKVEEVLSDDIFAPGNIAEINFGYAGVGMRKAYGVMTIPDVSLGEDSLITLNMEGLLFGMLQRSKQTVFREDPTDKTSAPLTGKKIIELLASELGFTGQRINFEFANDQLDKAPKQTEAFVQSTETHWEYIGKIARHYNCDAFERENKLYVVDRLRARDSDAPVVAIFRRFGQLDLPKNIYPLLEFATDTAGQLMTIGKRGIMVDGINPKEGVGAPLEADSSTPTSTQEKSGGERIEDTSKTPSDTGKTLAGPGVQVKGGFPDLKDLFVDQTFDKNDRQGGKPLVVPPGSRDLVKKLTANYQGAQLEALEATMATIGLPFLFPAQLIKIENVGKIFDKVYYTKSILHELGSDGYNMNLELSTGDVGIDAPTSNTATAAKNKEKTNSDDVTKSVEA